MPDLSPAAQAILDAYGDFEPADVDAMAAALRAVVEQCVYTDDYGTEYICPDDVLAIAAELEAQ